MIKGYSQLSRAYHAESSLEGQDYVDEVAFGFFNEEYDGGHSCKHGLCEVMMRWVKVGNRAVPKLELFYDGFGNLRELSNVLTELSHWTNDFDPEDFCELLDSFGFKDITKTERG